MQKIQLRVWDNTVRQIDVPLDFPKDKYAFEVIDYDYPESDPPQLDEDGEHVDKHILKAY